MCIYAFTCKYFTPTDACLAHIQQAVVRGPLLLCKHAWLDLQWTPYHIDSIERSVISAFPMATGSFPIARPRCISSSLEEMLSQISENPITSSCCWAWGD